MQTAIIYIGVDVAILIERENNKFSCTLARGASLLRIRPLIYNNKRAAARLFVKIIWRFGRNQIILLRLPFFSPHRQGG